MKRNGVEVTEVRLEADGFKPRLLNVHIAGRINADGTLTCHRCGNHLPVQTEARKRNVNILWDHDGITCYYTDEEKYGR